MTTTSVFEIGNYAKSLETGWIGKILAFEEHGGDRLAKMVGIDRIAQIVGGLANEEALSYDDIQWFATEDLIRLA